jgi:hypothetical protein
MKAGNFGISFGGLQNTHDISAYNPDSEIRTPQTRKVKARQIQFDANEDP